MAGHRVDTGDDPVDGPIDLAAVRADDVLLDAVHGRHAGTPSGPADEDLVGLLAAWRAEVDARPFPELVSLDEAVAAVESGRLPAPARRSGPRLLRRVPLVAAAAMALALVGLGTAVHGAMPGQPLWGVSEVVFSGRAESVRSAVDAQESLQRADAAIARREFPAAASLLSGAGSQIDGARAEDRSELEAERNRMMSSLPPGAPTAPTPDAAPGVAAPSSTAPSDTDAATTPAPTSTPAPATATSSPGTGTGTTTTTTTTPPALLPLPLPGG